MWLSDLECPPGGHLGQPELVGWGRSGFRTCLPIGVPVYKNPGTFPIPSSQARCWETPDQQVWERSRSPNPLAALGGEGQKVVPAPVDHSSCPVEVRPMVAGRPRKTAPTLDRPTPATHKDVRLGRVPGDLRRNIAATKLGGIPDGSQSPGWSSSPEVLAVPSRQDEICRLQAIHQPVSPSTQTGKGGGLVPLGSERK